MLGSSWVAAQLAASQERFSSVSKLFGRFGDYLCVLKALQCQTGNVSSQIRWRHGQDSLCNNALSFPICIPPAGPVYTSGALSIEAVNFRVKPAEI
jgi:hypothetical protein